jgi:3-oxoadipate enol-lactonase
VTIHHRLDGDGAAPVLVLSSSLGTTHEMWDPVVPALAARYHVLRYDHPGHGGSPAGPTTLEGIARAALGLLDELGLERVAFGGLSLGGMVGMWLGAHAPERVERLVLACTAPRLPPREFWQQRIETVRAEGVGAIADAVVARWFTPAWAEARPDVVRRYRELLASTPADGYARCCEAIRDMDLRPALARIQAPTTVVLGRHDPVVTDEARRDLAAIRGARVVELDAAHLASVERPDEFASAVLAP